MSRLAQGIVLWTVAFAVAFATANDTVTSFVRPGMRWPLFATCSVLAVVAAVLILLEPAVRPADADHRHPSGDDPAPADHTDDAPAHQHGRVTRTGWLFVIPFTVLPLAVAGPLGAYSAQRDSGVVASPPSDPVYPPLPAGDPLPLSLVSYSERAGFDTSNALRGRRVELTGFSSKTSQGQGWALTRMAIMCCAADAITVKVLPEGVAAPAPNTWVRVVGTWIPSTATGEAREKELPRLRVESLTRIPAPQEPYE